MWALAEVLHAFWPRQASPHDRPFHRSVRRQERIEYDRPHLWVPEGNSEDGGAPLGEQWHQRYTGLGEEERNDLEGYRFTFLCFWGGGWGAEYSVR